MDLGRCLDRFLAQFSPRYKPSDTRFTILNFKLTNFTLPSILQSSPKTILALLKTLPKLFILSFWAPETVTLMSVTRLPFDLAPMFPSWVSPAVTNLMHHVWSTFLCPGKLLGRNCKLGPRREVGRFWKGDEFSSMIGNKFEIFKTHPWNPDPADFPGPPGSGVISRSSEPPYHTCRGVRMTWVHKLTNSLK